MASTAWPLVEEKLLREKYPVHGAKWCAKHLYKSPTAVRTRASNLGISLIQKNSTHKKVSEEQEREIVALYSDGMDTVALADKFGLSSRGPIRRILRENGIERRGRGQANKRWTKEQQEDIVAAYESGERQTSIAKRLGAPQSSISYVLKKNGVKTRRTGNNYRITDSLAMKDIAAAYVDGCGVSYLANRYKVSEDAIHSVIAREGVERDNLRPSGWGVPRAWYEPGGALPILMRSSWEVLTAEYFDSLGVAWDYERETYSLLAHDGSKRTYTPDFWVYNADGSLGVLVDVKGRLCEDQEYRIELFTKQHPALILEIWDESALKERRIIR